MKQANDQLPERLASTEGLGDGSEARQLRDGWHGWMHIYAQPVWHADAYVCGTREAMLGLRAAIDAALEAKDGRSEMRTVSGDGEGYSVEVVVATEEQIQRMCSQYTDEIARSDDSGPQFGPWSLPEAPNVRGEVGPEAAP